MVIFKDNLIIIGLIAFGVGFVEVSEEFVFVCWDFIDFYTF